MFIAYLASLSLKANADAHLTAKKYRQAEHIVEWSDFSNDLQQVIHENKQEALNIVIEDVRGFLTVRGLNSSCFIATIFSMESVDNRFWRHSGIANRFSL